MSDEPKLERKSLIIKWDPPGWYNDASFGLRLLYGYIESVERQIDEAIERFRNEKQTEVIEYDDGWSDIITVHHGIHDGDYHLETVFEKYFPDLQRRSALITLVSFFEHQINDLSQRFAKEKNDLPGKGFERKMEYLKNEAGLSSIKCTAAWFEITNIQKIRNYIVHNDGRIKGNDDRETEQLIKYASSHQILQDEEEESVKITAEYLSHVINTFNRYFEGIRRLISLSQKIS